MYWKIAGILNPEYLGRSFWFFMAGHNQILESFVNVQKVAQNIVRKQKLYAVSAIDKSYEKKMGN
jgi:hypothetical protein